MAELPSPARALFAVEMMIDIDGTARADIKDVDAVVVVWDNYVRFLASCLRTLDGIVSLRKVIVVDNASVVPLGTTRSGRSEIIRAPRRLPLGAARNLGLGAVTAPFVVFADVDDVLHPVVVDELLEILLSEPHAVAAASSLVRTFVDGRTGRVWPHPYTRWLARSPRAWLAANVIKNSFPVVGCAVHRTSSCLAAGAFSPLDYGEDWGLANALLTRGRVVLCDGIGRRHLRHGANLGLVGGARNIAAASTAVRARVRADPASPNWLRRSLGLVSVLHAANSWRLARRYRREAAAALAAGSTIE